MMFYAGAVVQTLGLVWGLHTLTFVGGLLMGYAMGRDSKPNELPRR